MHHADDHILSDNPTTDSLTKLIGEELMVRLSFDLGGKILYIPLKAGAHCPLTVSVGLDAAKKICEVYGGMKFEVPNRKGRDVEVLALHKSGLSMLQIAHQMRLNRKTVAAIINRDLIDNHPKLF